MRVTNIPLKWKVILGVTVTSMLSVVLSVALFASIETGRLEQSVVTESETIASSSCSKLHAGSNQNSQPLATSADQCGQHKY